MAISSTATVHSRRVIHAAKSFAVVEEDVTLPHGRRVTRDIVEHPGAVVFLPITSEGKILLVKQYRHATKRVLLELPAGTIESGETPLECAKRESLEETGFAAKEWHALGEFFSAPGFCSELLYAFVAKDLTSATAPADTDEDIDLVAVSRDEFTRRVQSGEILDAKSIATFFLAELSGFLR